MPRKRYPSFREWMRDDSKRDQHTMDELKAKLHHAAAIFGGRVTTRAEREAEAARRAGA